MLVGRRANKILTAIVHGMKREGYSNHVRLAAITALLNSLELTKANFDQQVDNFIQEVIIPPIHINIHIYCLSRSCQVCIFKKINYI